MTSGVRRVLTMALTGLLAATVTVLGPAQPAQADGPVRVVLNWIKCFDESESFSDEPFIERAPGAQYIYGWTNVDGDGRERYLLTNREHWFEGSIIIDLKEDDGHWSEDDYLGTFWIQASEADTGLREREIRTSGYRYILQYAVFSS